MEVSKRGLSPGLKNKIDRLEKKLKNEDNQDNYYTINQLNDSKSMLKNTLNSSYKNKSMNISKNSLNNTGRTLKNIMDNKKNQIKAPDLSKKDNKIIPKMDNPRF